MIVTDRTCALQILALLNPFKDFCVWVQGCKFVTLSQVLRFWDALTLQLQSFALEVGGLPPPDAPRLLRTAVGDLMRRKLLKSLTERFERYLRDDENVLFATVLDPRNRSLWFVSADQKAYMKQRLRERFDMERVLASMPPPGGAAAAAAGAAAQASAIVAAPIAAARPAPPVDNSLVLRPVPADDPELKAEVKAPVDEVGLYFTNRDKCPPIAPADLQAGKWHEIDERGFGLAPVLQWWQTNGHHIPVLAKLAQRYLCIPASSAEPERVWSAAGRLCSDLRGRLSEESVETHLFLHRNMDLLPSL